MRNEKGQFKRNLESKRKYNPQYQKDYAIKQRNAAIEALGGKCVKCEFSDRRALQIDHINNDGHIERKNGKFGSRFNKHVLESFLKKENKYQLLCANCNWIKENERRNSTN